MLEPASESREVLHVHPFQGVVRTRALTGGTGELLDAEIALGGLENRHVRARVDGDDAVPIANLHHPDVVVRTAVRAGRAPDAGLVIDQDLTANLAAMDRSGRAADHAHGIDSVHAGTGHHVGAVLGTAAHEARVVLVRRRAGTYAVVAADTAVQIDHHRRRAV